ncbi:MAG: Hsp70 family protein, partial [Nitrososphaerota archaeon]
ADNVSLGRFTLSGIPPAPRGVPKIEVTFDINADGILTVTAKDLGTNKEMSVKITAPHRLSKEEIDKMIKEAEKYAEEDRRKKEEAILINDAESLIYSVEKALSEFGDKINQETKQKIEETMKSLRDAISKREIQTIKSKMEELRKAAQEIGAVIYQQAQFQKESQKHDDKTQT